MSVVRLRPPFLICCVLLVSACQNASDQTQTPQSTTELTDSSAVSTKIPVACKQPAFVEDIWKLEPILVEKGAITTEMSKGDKEKVIKEYIAKKNAQYKLCLKGSKK